MVRRRLLELVKRGGRGVEVAERRGSAHDQLQRDDVLGHREAADQRLELARQRQRARVVAGVQRHLGEHAQCPRRPRSVAEQAAGVGVAALAAAQLGEPDRGVRLQLAVAEAVEVGGLAELRLTLAPAAENGEDPAIAGQAAGLEEAVGAAVGGLEADPAPLLGAAEVAHLLARAEREAEGVADDQGVGGLAAGHRGHHLVEQHHALVDLASPARAPCPAP